jgi:creatinine amidohydrolase/Fe(II)-dependent formamide hydrolase-like protein
VYSKANGDFDEYLKSKGLPFGGHASIIDTSEMLYLGGDIGWVRKDLIKTAVGDPVPQRGEGGGRSEGGRGRGQTDPSAPPRINNGITGDARPSSAELGRYLFNLKVDYAVRQIQQLVGSRGSE